MPVTAQSNASAQLLVDLITGAADNPLSGGEEVCIDPQFEDDNQPQSEFMPPANGTGTNRGDDQSRPADDSGKPDAFSVPSKPDSHEANDLNDPARNIQRFSRLEAHANSDFSAYESIEAGEIFKVPAGMPGAGSHVMLFRGRKRNPEGECQTFIGLLRSVDNGISWQKLGEVVEAEKNRPSGLTNQ